MPNFILDNVINLKHCGKKNVSPKTNKYYITIRYEE